MITKKMYRIPSEGDIAGVCAGLGEHLAVDPIIFRILFIVFSISGGFGILVYLFMWAFVPVKPSDVESPDGEAN